MPQAFTPAPTDQLDRIASAMSEAPPRYLARRSPWVRKTSRKHGTFMFWGVWDTALGAWAVSKAGDPDAARARADAMNAA